MARDGSAKDFHRSEFVLGSTQSALVANEFVEMTPFNCKCRKGGEKKLVLLGKTRSETRTVACKSQCLKGPSVSCMTKVFAYQTLLQSAVSRFVVLVPLPFVFCAILFFRFVFLLYRFVSSRFADQLFPFFHSMLCLFTACGGSSVVNARSCSYFPIRFAPLKTRKKLKTPTAKKKEKGKGEKQK